MLHAKDLSPVRYAKMCKKENSEIPYTEITKGVDTGGGKYVVIDPVDFEKALPQKTKTIDIVSFCKQSEIDPIYFERSYFLEADKQSDKPYSLLLTTLEETGRVGIAKFVLRAKEHLAMLRPYKGILSLVQLRYDEEIADLSTIRFPAKSSASKEELSLAEKLVAQISKPFNPMEFHDTFTREVSKIIREKVKGNEVVAKQEEPVPTEVENLIDTLAKSIAKK